MGSSAKVWFLSFPYLLGIILGLALFLSHPKILESLYSWKEPSAYPEDALNIASAVWGPVPLSELASDLSTTQHFNIEEIEQLESLRTLRSTVQYWVIGLFSFSLLMLLLDRRVSWGQLHRRGMILLILLAVTLAGTAWFHMDWLVASFEKYIADLNPWTFDPQSYLNILYPKAFWKALGSVYLATLGALFLLPALLGVGSSREKEE